MRLSSPIAVLALLASVVTSVSVPGLPKCAGDCVSGYGGCGQLNVQCICNNHAFLTKLSCCVYKNCSPADQKKTIQFADSLCAGQGVSNLPTAATCKPTATAGSGSGSNSGSSSNSGDSTGNSASKAGVFEGPELGLGLVLAGLVAVL